MSFQISFTSFPLLNFTGASNAKLSLPQPNTKQRRRHLAAAPFMEYSFHTDARLWVMSCCQNLIAALATLQLGHIQRGYAYMNLCRFESICDELQSVCACVDPYPSMGCSAMALGFSILCPSNTLRCVPSKLATSIRDVPESVQ